MASSQVAIVLVSFNLLQILSGANSAKFTIRNNCSYTVWPGTLTGDQKPQLTTTGFTLEPGASNTLNVPAPWSGRLWGRTFCTQDITGKFKCVTGDCGSSTIECAGNGATPPATLAELTLSANGGQDFYDVSLVDGYNLPMAVEPQGGTGGICGTSGCVANLNDACPEELKVLGSDGGIVACKSPCTAAFGDPQYCCTGANSTPETCQPSSYSNFFKTACPRAYSYAYDDVNSTFTCASANYLITFCPLALLSPLVPLAPTTTTSVESNNKTNPVVAVEVSAGTRSTSMNFIAGFVIVIAAIWPLGELYMIRGVKKVRTWPCPGPA